MLRHFSLLVALSCILLSNIWGQTSPPTNIHLTELQGWLKTNWFDGQHSALGYNEARRQMYGYVDISGGQIECVYTGFTQSGGYVTYPNPINAEHLVPQSFFGSAEPMKSDIHILKPCHGQANSARSNKPFDEITDSQAQWYGTVGNTYTSQGNIPGDSPFWSETSGWIWEPKEESKGDVARAIFYFYTMYPGAAGNITEMGPTDILYQWHQNDPADAVEIARNTKVQSQQGNRNPYIDYPNLVYEAWFWNGNIDAVGPDFTGTPSTVSIVCGDAAAFNNLNASPTDPCTPISVAHVDVSSGTGCGGGDITRTYTANDGCGNTSTFIQIISFTDFVPPVFTSVPPDMTTNCDGGLGDLGTATANDNCSTATITVEVIPIGGPCPVQYEIHRVFTASDGCGNTATHTQIITIEPSVPIGCTTDVDADGIVTVNDLLLVLSEFGCTVGCLYDLNQDGIVGVTDILDVLATFGELC